MRGWIGVVPGDIPAEAIEQSGLPEGSVLVSRVDAGSPADSQGVARGDVITVMNISKKAGMHQIEFAYNAPSTTSVR